VCNGTNQTIDPDRYFGLTEIQVNFMEALRGWMHQNYPHPPIRLEISDGTAQDRLGVDVAAHEAMVLMKRPPGGETPRTVQVQIMEHDAAREYVEQNLGSAQMSDPCCHLVWDDDNQNWVCVGYGN
jgi:hypothetical protein